MKAIANGKIIYCKTDEYEQEWEEEEEESQKMKTIWITDYINGKYIDEDLNSYKEVTPTDLDIIGKGYEEIMHLLVIKGYHPDAQGVWRCAHKSPFYPKMWQFCNKELSGNTYYWDTIWTRVLIPSMY
jgi:hypothetical protein